MIEMKLTRKQMHHLHDELVGEIDLRKSVLDRIEFVSSELGQLGVILMDYEKVDRLIFDSGDPEEEMTVTLNIYTAYALHCYVEFPDLVQEQAESSKLTLEEMQSYADELEKACVF